MTISGSGDVDLPSAPELSGLHQYVDDPGWVERPSIAGTYNVADTLHGPEFTLDQLIDQEIVFQQGVQAMQQQQWVEAETLFRQSIAMGEVLPQLWGNLGICLLMQRRLATRWPLRSAMIHSIERRATLSITAAFSGRSVHIINPRTSLPNCRVVLRRQLRSTRSVRPIL